MGGKGSGRTVGAVDRGERLSIPLLAERLMRLKQGGHLQGTSQRVLFALGESSFWLEVISELQDERDWRTIADLLKFHQQMSEGKPAQRITVTSFGLQVNTDEIEAARKVVRELVSGHDTIVSPHDTFASSSPSETKANSLMLSAGEGGKTGGGEGSGGVD